MRPNNKALLVAMALAAASLAGCGSQTRALGTFDRTLSVNGPIHLELTTGSGDVHVTAGAAGAVRIHGEIHAQGWSAESAQKRMEEFTSNPPISQEGNLIRIGDAGPRMNEVSVDYTIAVPPDTELHCRTGSGGVEARGIQGPATLTSGSGDIFASAMGSDVQVATGSGDLQLGDIQGQLQVTTGSGDIQVNRVKGEARLRTGSGDISVTQPASSVEASSGSGDIEVKGATADLRLHSSSGQITVDGNPSPSNYWDFHTSSGDVSLHVPSDASFRLYARSNSGDIDAAIPVVMEGTADKHELRARIGDGKARVDIETSSGKIALH
jgi:DUF4097 and DUF4098 domain-containing protein YvlB